MIYEKWYSCYKFKSSIIQTIDMNFEIEKHEIFKHTTKLLHDSKKKISLKHSLNELSRFQEFEDQMISEWSTRTR